MTLNWCEILESFIRIPSTTGHEHEAAFFLQALLKERFLDAETSLIPIEGERCNVRCIKGSPSLTLTSHFDTVPGDVAVQRDEFRIVGRGACDAKGQIIAQLWGLSLAIEQGLSDYCCHFVVGEETDGVGARTLVSNNPKTPYILNGEPTGNRFVSKCWGAADVLLRATGTARHSSLGTEHSAVHALVRDLHRLIAADIPTVSINVGRINGGTAANVQAESASALLCVRMSDNAESALEILHTIVRECEVVIPAAPLIPITLFVPGSDASTSIETKFSSDCSVYAGSFDKVMLFGPGDIQYAHTSYEFISVSELEAAAKRIASLLGSL
jgi:acetylornithine deacetylase